MRSRRGGRSGLVVVLAASFLAAALPGPLLAQKAKRDAKDAKGSSSAPEDNPEVQKALLKATKDLLAKHVEALDRIASWAASSGLKTEASGLVARIEALDPGYKGLEKLKKGVEKAPAAPAEEKKAEDLKKAFAKRVETANGDNAERRFKLATDCMKVGLFSKSYELIQAVIEAEPDHKRARDILSFTFDRPSGKWITKWEADMRKKNFLTDEGWVETKHKKDWEKGLRDYQGKWITKEEEERIRTRNNYNPYKGETEHFVVESNLGRVKAFQFATLLEDFYSAFFPFYIGYYDQVAGAKLLFNADKTREKHRVMLFPSHVEYLEFVKAEKGNEELPRRSAGFFDPGDRRSYFYWTDDPRSTFSTLYHEVTHQLLDETKPSRGHAETQWLVEGIATYMETWEKVGGKWRYGTKAGIPQMQMAKSFLSQNRGWSIDQFVRITYKEFHEEPGRGLNYCMAGALVHFLIHGEDGIYKEDFIKLLKAYYEGAAGGDALPKYIKKASVSQLEKQFREYMEKLEVVGKGGEAAASES